MSIEEKTRLLLLLDDMVKRKVKGNATEYAAKMGIGRSTFFRLVQYARYELHAPLHHCPTQNRYEYQREGKLFFGFLPTDGLSIEEKKNTNGGHISYIDQWLGTQLFLTVSTSGTAPA
jgi:hypothetical protein